jgi:ABC-type amino acid transport system permease subunit
MSDCVSLFASVRYLFAYPELMLRIKGLAMMSFLPIHLFLLAALMYFLVSWPLSILTRRIELRLKHGIKSLTP